VSRLASAEAPRASCRARRLARLDLTIALKHRERAAGQDAGLVSSNHPPKRHTSEPSGKPPGPASNHPPKQHERAIGQDAGPVSIRMIRRSATSEASGNTLGPSRSEPSAEAIHERFVEQAVAAEPRAIRRSSRSQRAQQISNRTP